MQTLLAFDFGTQKIGVAVGQFITRTATPLVTLRNHGKQPNWTAITKLIETWHPNKLIVGIPLPLDNTENINHNWLACINNFARQLNKMYQLPVSLIDERLTSQEARQQIADRRTKSLKSRRDNLDSLAAALILETWLSEQP